MRDAPIGNCRRPSIATCHILLRRVDGATYRLQTRACGGMNTPETRAKNAERKRRLYRRKIGLPEDAVLVMTPEQRREKDIQRKRLAYRRKHGLPDDYVRKTVEDRKAYQREWLRKKNGWGTKEERLAKLAAARAEKEREKEAAKLARIRERAIQAARRAEEREARQCSRKYGNGTKTKSGSASPASTVRKPGRIQAMAGWHGW
jgi:hypothetical protein